MYVTNGFVNGNGIPLETVTTAQFALAWPLLISNTYRCTASDSRCSTHYSAILHPFLMSNSHPLDLFFTPFEPVAHPLLAVVVATVPFFFPMVSETVPSDLRIYLLRGPEQPPATCNSLSNLLLPIANIAIARATGQYGRQRQFPAGGGAIWKRRRERICRGANCDTR